MEKPQLLELPDHPFKAVAIKVLQQAIMNALETNANIGHKSKELEVIKITKWTLKC